MPKFHFISGLPRSGSTLLSAILKQNPKFHANMSGPVAGLVGGLLSSLSARNEFSVFIDDDKRRSVIKSVFDSYYADSTAEVVFDTSRSWCARMSLLNELHPQSKVIACVRQMPWVIDSIERLVQKNVFQPSSIFGYMAGGTVYNRSEAVAKGDGMVGYAFNALKEAYFGEFAAGRLMLLQYETLVADPEKAINALYDFIGEAPFEHDFENIEFDATEFDLKAGTPGLHEIKPRIVNQQRKTVLPPDVFNRYLKDAFWAEAANQREGVLIV